MSALVIALVLVVAVGSLLSWLVVRGFPQREGVATIAGLSAPVRVVRDANGVPHVYAATTRDLFMAQGWLHASERMWQMEIWRRIGSGRLSELFGPDQLATDRFIRVLGWRQAAEADLAATSAEGRLALEAYVAGVNAWLESHPELPLPFVIAGFLGPGGGLAGFRPEPWTVIDTLSWQKVQAYSLGSDIDRELFRHLAQHSARPDPISDEALAKLLPGYDMTRPVVVPTDAAPSVPARVEPRVAGSASDLAAAIAILDADRGLRDVLGLPGGTFNSAGLLGSNAWAVAPSRSATGRALLANDPHLGISMPSVWYLVGLHCRPVGPDCPYELAGAGFPGGPGIILGHNARIAWGLTNVGPDVMDIFEETVDPDDRNRYLYKGESLAFEERVETIGLAGGGSETLVIRSTVHGPVISDVVDELESGTYYGDPDHPGAVYAVAWAATAEPDRTFDAVLAVSRAQDWQAFREALRDFGAPSQTYVYADVDGHIGVQVPGRIPIRAAGDGTRPVPGEDGAYDWSGWVPFDEMPFLYDPPSGLIVAANNLPSDGGPFLGRDFDPGYRAERLAGLLGDAPVSTALSHRLQADDVLTRAAPVIAATSGATPQTDDGRRVLEVIRGWLGDLRCSTDSAGCAAYEAFEYRLLRGLVDDELAGSIEAPEIASRWVGSEVSHEALVRLVAAPADAWWDDTRTADRVETRDDIMARALDEAGADLRATLGDPAGWTWGRIHSVTFREETLGASGIGPLEALFNRGPYPAPGSCTTINKICGRIASVYPPDGETADLRAVFAATSSPSYRLVIDMGDLDGASFIQTTGQSGLPFDRHYGDLIDDWLGNTGLVIPWSDAAVDGAARHELVLQP